MSEQLLFIVVILIILAIVGTIVYFLVPHEPVLPQRTWMILALAMWAPFWWIWGIVGLQLADAIGTHNPVAMPYPGFIVLFTLILPSFWYLSKRRFQALAMFWIKIMTFGRARNLSS